MTKKKERNRAPQQKLRDASHTFANIRNVLVQEIFENIGSKSPQKKITQTQAHSYYTLDMRIKTQSEAILGILENKQRDVGVLEVMSGAMSEELTGPFDFNTLFTHIYQESKYIGKLAFVRHHLMPDDGESSSGNDQEMLQYMSTLLFDYYKVEEKQMARYEANKYTMTEDGQSFVQAKGHHEEIKSQLAKIISFLEDFTKDSEHKPIFELVDIYMDLEFLRAQIHHAMKDVVEIIE